MRVLKENQRIINRIRMIEQEVYDGTSAAPIQQRTEGESASMIISDDSHSDSEYVSHKVKSGENLWVIAQQYGTSMEAIAEANHMESISDIIKPGQVLRIPVKE